MSSCVIPNVKKSNSPLGRIEENRITSKALENNLLGDPATREFEVYLPPDYDTGGKRYPVVFVLHGMGRNARYLVDPSRKAMDDLIKKKEAREMILVFPDGSNKLGGSYYMNSPTIGDYETYIAKELVGQIDATYRTIPNRNSRGIMGCSMGGWGALHLALKYPDVFGVAAPMSGFGIFYPHEMPTSWRLLFTVLTHRKAPDESSGLINPADFLSFLWRTRCGVAVAAATSSNPDKPPLYLDLPYRFEKWGLVVDREVVQKADSRDTLNDIKRYLEQPFRLNALLIFADNEFDEFYEAKLRAMDRDLTDRGLPHDFFLVDAGHCDYDFSPILKFMNDHLEFMQVEKPVSSIWKGRMK
jgi:S-formylglutathione hydrolase